MSFLKTTHIVAQCFEKFLGMLGRQNNTALHFGLRSPGHHADKVDHKLRNRVVDNSQIGINSLGGFFIQLNIDNYKIGDVSISWEFQPALIGSNPVVFGPD